MNTTAGCLLGWVEVITAGSPLVGQVWEYLPTSMTTTPSRAATAGSGVPLLLFAVVHRRIPCHHPSHPRLHHLSGPRFTSRTTSSSTWLHQFSSSELRACMIWNSLPGRLHLPSLMVSHLKQSRQNLHEGIKAGCPGYYRIQMVCPAAHSWCQCPWRWHYNCCIEAGPAYGYRLSGISWLAVALQELTWDPQHHTSWRSRQRWYQRSGAVQSQITGATAGELAWKTLCGHIELL